MKTLIIIGCHGEPNDNQLCHVAEHLKKEHKYSRIIFAGGTLQIVTDLSEEGSDQTYTRSQWLYHQILPEDIDYRVEGSTSWKPSGVTLYKDDSADSTSRKFDVLLVTKSGIHDSMAYLAPYVVNEEIDIIDLCSHYRGRKLWMRFCLNFALLPYGKFRSSVVRFVTV